MPLKHSTETLLLFLLGVAILLAAIAAALLPPLVQGVLPWTVALVISVGYPLLLHPLLRSRRADYAFRLLHFVPALMLLLWFVLQILEPVDPTIARVGRWYRWGWTLPAVIVGYLLLIAFCCNVVRQQRPRLLLLFLLFIPFLGLGITSERRDWTPTIVAFLQEPGYWSTLRRWMAQVPTGVGSDSEEKLKMQLRRMERRTERLERETEGSLQVQGTLDAARRPLVASATPPQKQTISPVPVLARKTTRAMPYLPPSGFGSEVALPLVLAGYTGLLHWRVKRCAQQWKVES